MYRFQITAQTQPGESIGLVGSIPKLGLWNEKRCIRLQTSRDRYPLWWIDIDLNAESLRASSSSQRVEYKYVRLSLDGSVQWETLEATNRWVPIETNPPASPIIVEDTWFGHMPPYPYGYLQEPASGELLPQGEQGLKVVVIGSSVAMGCSAWLLRGWSWHLAQVLHHQYGHQLVNVSELGANVSKTIARFPQVVTPQKPDIVIIALSLGNEGFAYCSPQDRPAAQQWFEDGLQKLIAMVRELGARPILAGVYPHEGYTLNHYWLLQETHQRMLSWGVPVLDWLGAIENGRGRWKTGISFDPAHPNTEGHRLMYEAIDLRLFQVNPESSSHPTQLDVPVYQDSNGFTVVAGAQSKSLHVTNPSPYPYQLSPSWLDWQTAVQQKARLTPGLYIGKMAGTETTSFLAVQEDGAIETTVPIPPGANLEYRFAYSMLATKQTQILFHNEDLALVKDNDCLYVLNESNHEYNIHPMWKEVRSILTAMPPGVYHDPQQPDAPFRTMMIGAHGLESRVKAPPRSIVTFSYQCALSAISRIAIIPLGDRCAARMLLYKMEYDGPAFPFDLTRTTDLGDVADMIASHFDGMWDPAFLHYNSEARRIYHSRWSGLSFAHEVEDTDDPINNMAPVHERMRTRYSARSERFWYTLRHCDKALFIRTGGTTRGHMIDLVNKLEAVCQGKPFWVLLISLQSSDEFAGLPHVLHYDLEFNPDRMYEDLGHWLYCTEVLRGILDSLGVSSQNLFWCPPNPPKD